MKRKLLIALLCSTSLMLGGCFGDEEEKVDNKMLFGSYEECAMSIGKENCQKDPVPASQLGVTASNGSMPSVIFLPSFGYNGGYLHDAPPRQTYYQAAQPIYRAPPSTKGAPAPIVAAPSKSFSSGGSTSTTTSTPKGTWSSGATTSKTTTAAPTTRPSTSSSSSNSSRSYSGSSSSSSRSFSSGGSTSSGRR